MHPLPRPVPTDVSLPAIAAVCVSAGKAHVLTPDGELQTLPPARAAALIQNEAALVCHAPFTKNRLDLENFQAFDVLELFAFVHPAKFCVPTPKGLCAALGLDAPKDAEDLPFALFDIARVLLSDLQNDVWKAKADPLAIAAVMGLRGKGWSWSPFVFAALGEEFQTGGEPPPKSALAIWKHLPEWAEEAPEPPPSHHGVTEEEARDRLTKLLGGKAEQRDKQMEYASLIAKSFQPMHTEGEPHIVLAEAGTGIGKTLGYLAPASVWAEKNQGTVWLSTYTKNLQKQIDQELDKLYPDPDLKAVKVAVRKGRENYLCLLNLEDFAAGASLSITPNHAIAAGIMARWAAASKDGDLNGGDFPGWLVSLLGVHNTVGLADKRGECIFSACDHYHRCFVERSLRKAERARIVVANHALVLIQAAMNPPGSAAENIPTRAVFDEGHHLFSAADSAFAAHLSGREARDLRRWVLGAEGDGRKSRARGLKKRLEDLLEGDEKGLKYLSAILHGANALSAEGWSKRLQQGDPHGACEEFLALVYKQVFARADGREGPYSLEVEPLPLIDELPPAAKKLKEALEKLKKPMKDMAAHLLARLADDDGEMGADTRKRMDSVAASLHRRGEMVVAAWINMLDALLQTDFQAQAAFVDWFEIERMEGRAYDVGYYRHTVDPMVPFAASLKPHLHGAAITSATLGDGSGDWSTALRQSGAGYLSPAPSLAKFASPFDYAAQSKVFVINDVNKNDLRQVAGAYAALFSASGGGGLGLFTAISRLKAVHEQIAASLEEEGIPLYAQHIEDIDTGSLVDIFRAEEHACLLGTDAMRDGVDVAGESLRLLVFDRVPWPRPTILHKARRGAFADLYGGPKGYDETVTRQKLKQAFGRLIRRADDKGVFVMLDGGFPSRLYDAFPADVEVVKCGLAEASASIRKFLQK
jgi:ATP-dependent DNA helicase DinG